MTVLIYICNSDHLKYALCADVTNHVLKLKKCWQLLVLPSQPTSICTHCINVKVSDYFLSFHINKIFWKLDLWPWGGSRWNSNSSDKFIRRTYCMNFKILNLLRIIKFALGVHNQVISWWWEHLLTHNSLQRAVQPTGCHENDQHNKQSGRDDINAIYNCIFITALTTSYL